MHNNRFRNSKKGGKASPVSYNIVLFNVAAAGGGAGYHFIMRAHLEVLKQEDIEDQFLSKKIADILCSPRRLRQSAAF